MNRPSLRPGRGGRGVPPRDVAIAALVIVFALVITWPTKRRSGAAGDAVPHAPLADRTNETARGQVVAEASLSSQRAVLDVTTSSAGSPERGASTSSGTSGAEPGRTESDDQARRNTALGAAADDTTADWQRYLEIIRTPLERSPGYVRPYDPEWRAVVRGRREAPEVSMPLAGGEPSLEALAQAILDAAARRDVRALRELHLTEEECTRIVWPELPQSRPIAQALPSDAWMFTHADMVSGIERMISETRGRSARIAGVSAAVADTFRNFTIRRDVVFSLRHEGGAPEESRYVSVAIERQGRWKVMLYEE